MLKHYIRLSQWDSGLRYILALSFDPDLSPRHPAPLYYRPKSDLLSVDYNQFLCNTRLQEIFKDTSDRYQDSMGTIRELELSINKRYLTPVIYYVASGDDIPAILLHLKKVTIDWKGFEQSQNGFFATLRKDFDKLLALWVKLHSKKHPEC